MKVSEKRTLLTAIRDLMSQEAEARLNAHGLLPSPDLTADAPVTTESASSTGAAH